jgi:hypothetical protein
MPSRAYALGLGSNISLQAALGIVTPVSLITAASGTVQNGYKAATDVIVITGANGSNTAVTLPEVAPRGQVFVPKSPPTSELS